jgi:1-deoxy-D-xylulose-5-phosphate reductoisomerase
MSACNEIVVEAFLAGDVPWLQIADTIEAVMDSYSPTTPRDVDDILEADRQGRAAARRRLGYPEAG